jgi:hypothetical protein
MSQKRKDSTELKGEMTMITCASRLKKVPDAPLDLADNNPTLVTPLKKMQVMFYVISPSDGCMPHFAKLDKYIEGLDASYTVDKFESLDEAIMHYTNQIQACSLALASKAPVLFVSSVAETGGNNNEQPEPCPKPRISAPVKTVASLEQKPPAIDFASDPCLKKPSDSKEKILKCFERLFLKRARKLQIPLSFLCSRALTRRILSLLLIFRMPRVKSTGSLNQPFFLLLLKLLLITFLD